MHCFIDLILISQNRLFDIRLITDRFSALDRWRSGSLFQAFHLPTFLCAAINNFVREIQSGWRSSNGRIEEPFPKIRVFSSTLGRTKLTSTHHLSIRFSRNINTFQWVIKSDTNDCMKRRKDISNSRDQMPKWTAKQHLNRAWFSRFIYEVFGRQKLFFRISKWNV